MFDREIEIDDCDVFTIEEFEDDIRDGWIINYDGVGYYGNATHYSNVPVQFAYGKLIPNTTPEGATHVIWFNR